MKKMTKAQAASKRIRLAEGERVHVGIDVHKRWDHVAVWSRQREALVTSWVHTGGASALAQALEPYRERIERIVYEAGPTGFGLARLLRDRGFVISVVSASHTPRTRDAKSDRIDCRKLAEYSAKGMLRAVYIPTPQEEEDRQISRMRETRKEDCARAKQRIKSFLLQHGIGEPKGLGHWTLASVSALRSLTLPEGLRWSLDLLLEDLDYAKRQLKRASEALERLTRAARHEAKARVARSVPGVGLITTATVLTELPSPERFSSERQVGKMMGLSPEVRSSGETRKELGRERGGNRRLRTALVEAAWRWVAHDPWAAQRYRHVLSRTGNSKKAIVAMARKLGIILWRMLTRGEAYRGLQVQGAGNEKGVGNRRLRREGASPARARG